MPKSPRLCLELEEIDLLHARFVVCGFVLCGAGDRPGVVRWEVRY